MCTLNALVHLTSLKIPLSNPPLNKNTKAKECRRDVCERSSLFLPNYRVADLYRVTIGCCVCNRKRLHCHCHCSPYRPLLSIHRLVHTQSQIMIICGSFFDEQILPWSLSPVRMSILFHESKGTGDHALTMRE